MAARHSNTSHPADFFRKLGRLLVSGTRNGDLPMFVLFLLLSFFFWASRNMSGESEKTVVFPVRLTGVADDVRVTGDVTPSVKVVLRGSGIALAREARREHILTVNASAFSQSVRSSRSVAVSSFADSVRAMLPANVDIVSLSPDSLSYGYVREVRRRLPVRLDAALKENDMFRVDRITLTPDSVDVKVPDGDSSICEILTKPVSVEVSSSVQTVNVGLAVPDRVSMHEESVNVMVEASEATEKVVEVPVSCLNTPEKSYVKAFPSKVKVSFRVSLNDFENIGPEDFQAVIDCQALQQSQNKAEVMVVRRPEGVDKVRVSPLYVEYLIETAVGTE